MITKLNHYLLLNHPKLWKSNIHWSLFVTIIVSIVFYLFADNFDNELNDENSYEYEDEIYYGGIPLFLWSGVILFWLYTQYKNQLPLRKYSFFEVLTSNLLNLVSTIITILPVLVLITLGLDEREGRYANFYKYLEMTGFIIAVGLIPIVYSSLIIRFYSLVEILLVLLFGFLYCLFTGFIFVESISPSETSLSIFFSVNYILLLGYIVIKFLNRSYTQIDKRLALAAIFYTPWFLGMNQIVFYDYDTSFETRIFGFCIHVILSITILSTFSWIITKSIQKPITIK